MKEKNGLEKSNIDREKYYPSSDIRLVIPPKGKRNKPIVIEARFLEKETETNKRETDEILAKHFISFGLNTY